MKLILSIVAISWALAYQACGEYASHLTTITNPTPEASDGFGVAVAPVGSDLILIGATGDNTGLTGAGAAYLYRADGSLLTTITNPVPVNDARFGGAVAALDAKRVIIGAWQGWGAGFIGGVAFLHATNGTRLATFDNPEPGWFKSFGRSVVGLGGDRIIVGAPGNSNAKGAAYLFNTNGTLLATFNNPISGTSQIFGESLAVVGADKVLVGAPRGNVEIGAAGAGAGAAYLFDTNGVLLKSFADPTPLTDEYFGGSVAAFGSDRVLIGAQAQHTTTNDYYGAAYLFDLNGNLLTTFNNPTPAHGDGFGGRVAAISTDLVLISAAGDDTAAANAGAVYVFNTNGVLLTTFTKPGAASADSFGAPIAVLGTDKIIVGTSLDDLPGIPNTGMVRLFQLSPGNGPPPTLKIALTDTNTIAVFWPTTADFHLQENFGDLISGGWSNVVGTVTTNGGTITYVADPAIGARFYRLAQP